MTTSMAREARPLLAAERRARIAELLAEQRSVRVSELGELFCVTTVTIRSDLDALARQGLLVRERGGAIADAGVALVMAFDQRASLYQEEKRRIGRAAAQLVSPGDAIMLDAGTTIMEMARSLSNVSPLTVVTVALNVATLMGARADVQVTVVGGSLSRDTISTIGPHTEQHLDELVVQKAFLGAHAFESITGVTDMSVEAARTKQAMIRAARQVILLADSSKWERIGFAKVVPLSAIHTVVTDTNLPADAQTAIERLGINLILA